jgi:molybdenum-dependent DNA-binding transcriptional regulator ModE
VLGLFEAAGRVCRRTGGQKEGRKEGREEGRKMMRLY